MSDSAGNPTLIKLSSGNIHDIDVAFEFLDELPKITKNILADKGYDSDLFRKSLISLGKIPTIPGRKNRREKIEYDKEKYRERHVVENLFCKLKQFRSIATRFEKHAVNYLNMVILGCIVIWMKL